MKIRLVILSLVIGLVIVGCGGDPVERWLDRIENQVNKLEQEIINEGNVQREARRLGEIMIQDFTSDQELESYVQSLPTEQNRRFLALVRRVNDIQFQLGLMNMGIY